MIVAFVTLAIVLGVQWHIPDSPGASRYTCGDYACVAERVARAQRISKYCIALATCCEYLMVSVIVAVTLAALGVLTKPFLPYLLRFAGSRL
eukprot:6204260-Pleurochrysis_carterae.AAC.1